MTYRADFYHILSDLALYYLIKVDRITYSIIFMLLYSKFDTFDFRKPFLYGKMHFFQILSGKMDELDPCSHTKSCLNMLFYPI